MPEALSPALYAEFRVFWQVLEVFEKKLLGFDNFPEKIRKAFEWAIDHDSKKGVQQFAYLTTTDDKLHEKMVGMDFKELCRQLNDKQYMPCVRSVYEHPCRRLSSNA